MTARLIDTLEMSGEAAEPTLTDLSGTMLTGVTGHFSAAHESPEGQMHGHSYQVTAWFSNSYRGDARCFRAALDQMLKLWDHKVLPPELEWGEDIARTIGTLANCVEVHVSRPLEGFHARWISSERAKRGWNTRRAA